MVCQQAKYIFLDIDGVLVPGHGMNLHTMFRSLGDVNRFNAKCVKALNQITDKTGAKIVISSIWRHLYSDKLDDLFAYIVDQGVRGEIVGCTPVLHIQRGDEIQIWLDENGAVPSQCVIIDDDSDMNHLLHRHVKTKLAHGLTRIEVPKILALFNMQ